MMHWYSLLSFHLWVSRPIFFSLLLGVLAVRLIRRAWHTNFRNSWHEIAEFLLTRTTPLDSREFASPG
jgi:hypothetical protein